MSLPHLYFDIWNRGILCTKSSISPYRVLNCTAQSHRTGFPLPVRIQGSICPDTSDTAHSLSRTEKTNGRFFQSPSSSIKDLSVLPYSKILFRLYPTIRNKLLDLVKINRGCLCFCHCLSALTFVDCVLWIGDSLFVPACQNLVSVRK